MIKKGLLGVSIAFQVILIGFMVFIVVQEKDKTEIIEDIFTLEKPVAEIFEEETSSFSLPFKSYIEAVGVIIPTSGYVKVTNPLEGVVDNIYVSLGDLIKSGDPLFKLNDNAIYVEIKEKEARLEKAVAQLKFQKRGPSQYALLKQQKAIEEIEIKKENQEKEAAVFESLLAKTAVSMSENDEKHMFLQITEKELEKAKADLSELCSSISEEEEEIFLNDIEEKKAALKQSSLKLESSLVKSPMNGRVVDISVSKGRYIGDRGLVGVTIVQEDPALLKVSISEAQVHKLVLSKALRAIAVHKSNPDIYFILDYAYFNPKMSIYKNDERKLDLFFSFEKRDAPVYIEQSLNVYIETVNPVDLSFLHYKFN